MSPLTSSLTHRHRQPPEAAPGVGIALKHQHYRDWQDTPPPVGWLEVHSENYFGGGRPLAVLESLRADYPVSLHGVGLSLGSAGSLSHGHLQRLKTLQARIEPAMMSEHLSWSSAPGAFLADLLPLPYTEEALALFCAHVDETQDFLGRRILIENPSSYLAFAHSTIPEWEFLAAVVARTGCGLLLDVNNIYVSACNHGFDPLSYLDALPAAAVGEIHLAGHSIRQVGGRALRIDDHGSAVCDDVWALYAQTVARLGPRPTLIEWDSAVPPLQGLLSEAEKARLVLAEQKEAACAEAG